MKQIITFFEITSSLRVSLLLLFSFLTYFLSAQNQWQEIGLTHQEGQASTTKTASSAIAFDNTGTAYIGYYDVLDHKVVVKKQVGNDWVQVGNGASVSIGVGSPLQLSLAVTNNGNMYVYFSSSYNSSLYKYNGSVWAVIYSFNSQTWKSVSMVTDTNNNLYVCYLMASGLLMTKYDGTSWGASSVVDTASSSASTAIAAMGIDNNQNPYIAYRDNLNNGKVTVKKYDGTNWVTIGAAGFSLYVPTTKLDIRLDLNNTPYVFYQNMSSGTYLMKYDGANWIQVGSVIMGVLNNDLDFAIDNTGVPYVVKAGGGVIKYDGTNWVTVGYDSPTFANQTSVDLAFSPTTNIPYKIAKTPDLNEKLCVYKFNGTFWELVVKPGIGITKQPYNNEMDMALDANGVPYTAYIDFENASKITVKKYNGTSWVLVGTAGFSTHAAAQVKLAIDGDGMPYIAYANSPATGATSLIIMKYDGTSWVNVGSVITSAKMVRHIALAIDDNNTPYFAYENEMVYVLKFSGVISWVGWVNVGSSPSTVNNQYYNCFDFAIDANNTPYVVFNDQLSNNMGRFAVVKKYIGNAWVNVGNDAVMYFEASDASLAFDANNKPYVALSGPLGTTYEDYNYVLKFNNSNNSWSYVGNVEAGPFISIPTSSLKLSIDNAGVPYMTYYKTGNNYVLENTEVVRFNGSEWIEMDFRHYGKNTLLAINNTTHALYAGYAAPEVFMSSYSLSPAALVTSNMDNNIACLNSAITFTASLLSYSAQINATSYQWKKNGANIGTNSNTLTLTGGTSVNTNDSIYCEITYTGATSGTMLSNKMAMRVLEPQTASVSCYQGNYACSGVYMNFSILFDSAYTGINYQYEWYKNNTVVGIGPTFGISSSNLVTGDSIKCKITSSLPCQSASTFYATPYIANIGTSIFVSISTPNTTVCNNVPVTFTATLNVQVYDNTFQWKKNGINVARTNVPYFTFGNLYNANNALITCEYTSDVCPSLIAFSNTITMNVLSSGNGSISIAASQNYLCSSNTAVKFTAVPNYSIYVNPTLQWKKNGVIIAGATSTTYTTTGLSNGDIIVCEMITNNSCKPIISANAITMIVSNEGYINVPTIKITNELLGCGAYYTPYTLYTQSTWAGSNPVYQWKKDGINIGTNSPTYTISGNNPVGSVYTCEMTSNATCALDGTIVSQSIVPNFSPSDFFYLRGSLSSAEEAGCPGDTVSYGWGAGFCDNCGCYYTEYSSDFGNELSGSEEGCTYIVGVGSFEGVSAYLDPCLFGAGNCPNVWLAWGGYAIPNTTSWNGVASTLSPTISIAYAPYHLCGSDTLIFTATATYGGKYGIYQWQINGENVVGATQKQVAFDNLQNGDIVTCALTSSIACTVPNYLVSNAITVIYPNTLFSPSICAGGATTITFNPGADASAYTWQQSTNGGASWYNVSGTNSTTTSIVATLTRLFRVIYNSATCGIDTTPIFTLNVVPDPTVTLTASSNNFCAGGNTTLTATLNGGVGTGIYQWQQYIGGVWTNIVGATENIYPTPVLSANTNYRVISSQTGLDCVTTGPNTISITVKPLPLIYTYPAAPTICVGGSQTIRAYNGTSYSWSPAIGLSATTGASVVANPTISTTYTLTGWGTNGCSIPIAVPVVVNPCNSIMTLFPNPAEVNLTILLSTTEEEKVTFTLTDMLGKNVSTWQGKAENGMYEQEISIENLPQGIYFLSVKIGNSVMTQKFVKE